MINKIEISDDVLRAACEVFSSTPNLIGLREALRNACKVAIKADRASDARVLAERQACVEIVQKMPLRKIGDVMDYAGAIRDTVAAIRARNGGDHEKSE